MIFAWEYGIVTAMGSWESFIKQAFDLIGFKDYRVEIKPEEKKGLVFIYENPELIKEHLPMIVDAMNHIVQMVAR